MYTMAATKSLSRYAATEALLTTGNRIYDPVIVPAETATIITRQPSTSHRMLA